MAVSPDENFQQLSTVQNAAMLAPVTLASATTVSPSTFLTFITGTTAVVTVTPPASGTHMLCFVFTTTTPTAFTTAGNIKAIATPTSNVPCFLVWNPLENKYYAKS